MKNAGKACNNRLYRHIRTFEKIVKNYFVILDENVPFFKEMYPFLKKCTLARHQKVCYVILAKEGKQKGQQVGQKNLSIARVND